MRANTHGRAPGTPLSFFSFFFFFHTHNSFFNLAPCAPALLCYDDYAPTTDNTFGRYVQVHNEDYDNATRLERERATRPNGAQTA